MGAAQFGKIIQGADDVIMTERLIVNEPNELHV